MSVDLSIKDRLNLIAGGFRRSINVDDHEANLFKSAANSLIEDYNNQLHTTGVTEDDKRYLSHQIKSLRSNLSLLNDKPKVWKLKRSMYHISKGFKDAIQ